MNPRQGWQARAHWRSSGLSEWLLSASADHTGRDASLARAAGSERAFQHGGFEQYQRSEKALVAALGQMYVQVVSTGKVAAGTQELCGQEFSASSISAITRRLEEQLAQFSQRPLEVECPYVILDARYERVREGGVSCGP